MQIKLGALSNAYVFSPLEQALRGIAGTGYRYVEIMCDRPHMFAGDYSKDDRLRIRKFCDELNLEIVALECINVAYSSFGFTPPVGPWSDNLFYPNPNGNKTMLTALDPTCRRLRIDYIKAVIDMAVEMGISKVETGTGKWVSHPDVAMKLAIEGVKECLAYAEKKKVMLILELAETLIYGKPDEMIELIDKIGSPYLKACVDIAHLEAEYMDIPETIKKLKNYVGNFHVGDTAKHKHYHLIVGKGDIDWVTCFSAIKEIGYTGSACLEIYPYALDPDPALTESRQYLTNCIGKI
jgi:sugar phosphate isomerase/epimerase